MRRLLAILAAVLLAMSVTPPASANILRGGVASGDEDDGDYKDLSYNNGDVSGGWVRKSHSSYDRGVLSAYIHTGALADWQGYNTCLQIVFDWDTPVTSPGRHYDSRMLRVCKANTLYYMNGGVYKEPTYQCIIAPMTETTCDMPMGRVQIARYVPVLGVLIDSTKECWYREGGHTIADCEDWEPLCPPDRWACRGWILQRDGDPILRDGGSSVYWDH